MSISSLYALVTRHSRSFGVIRESPALHFYLLQFVVFTYMAWRFASRDYTVYGLLNEDFFDYPRTLGFELWPVKPVDLVTFQFVYWVLPRPGSEVIFSLQMLVLVGCGLGVAGIKPKWCAICAFAVALHLTGMIQSSNSEIDGGTLVLCALLVLALSPERSFYGWQTGFHPQRLSAGHHWPIFVLFLVVGVFYSMAGLNKIVDVGPHWPFVLRLENLAQHAMEQSLFLSSRYVNPAAAELVDAYVPSIFAGFVTLAGELGFILILWFPRWRWFFVTSMMMLHLMVYLLAGINFIGSVSILLLCLDWNNLIRTAVVRFNPADQRWARRAERLSRWDWFGLIEWVMDERAEHAILDSSEGQRYERMEALEQVYTRIPLTYPLAVAMKAPGALAFAGIAARRAGARVERRRETAEPRGDG